MEVPDGVAADLVPARPTPSNVKVFIQPQDLPPPEIVVEAPASPAAAAPAWDLTVGLINATVQLDQPLGDGTRTVGTGFLVDAPTPDGQPRTLLVTAAHVLERMPDDEARVGWRSPREGAVGWRFEPQQVAIRDDGVARWTRHPDQDIAVMRIEAPEAFTRAAIPLGWLAERDGLDTLGVGPGDELMALGFPRGLSSNRAGFPILRVGRVASWPLTPIEAFPTFLLDFKVFSGNSGGPVFWTAQARRRPGVVPPDHPFVAGVLVQSVILDGEQLDIGVVAHAAYIREAIAVMDGSSQPARTAQ
ncbi:trypsin-like peptidase domain-containing protein [Brevundimonas lutea]|uniref:trypsin-like peptidase domain-containing protein n=1 Tax=Brevundimonas lutea TaxID=2293980 RepID=UPI000F02DEDD